MPWQPPCKSAGVPLPSSPTCSEPSFPAHDDLLLARRLVAKDASALEDLYSRYAAVVFSLACRICRDRALAEEATQNVFIQAWRDAARYDSSRGTLRSWLLVMARGRSLDRLRAQRSIDTRLTPLDAVGAAMCESAPSPEAEVVNSEEGGHLRSVMTVLPAPDRTLLELAYFQGLTHSEIAGHLNQPLGTVKTHMRRVLRVMRRAIVDDAERPFAWFPDARETIASTGQLSDLHVLVVEDDPSTLQLTGLVLQRAGARVIAASSAAQARRRLHTALPDLLLTDLEMPEEDGYSLLHSMRQLAGGDQIPAVAFTAHGDAEDRHKTTQAGFALHVLKPVRPATLVARLGTLTRGLSLVRPAPILSV